MREPATMQPTSSCQLVSERIPYRRCAQPAYLTHEQTSGRERALVAVSAVLSGLWCAEDSARYTEPWCEKCGLSPRCTARYFAATLSRKSFTKPSRSAS